jgi:hypothetical protein
MLKAFKTALLCGAAVLVAGPANAEPITLSIAFALFSGPLGAIASFSAIYTGLQIVAAAAVVGAQLAYGALSKQKIQPQEYKNTFQEAPNQSEIRAVGRVRLGGLKVFGNTLGVNRYRLIGHCRGPWSKTEAFFLNGIEMVVDPDGTVSSLPYGQSDGNSYIRIDQKIGDGTETAWSALTAAFPTMWTSDYRVRGIFQSLVRYISPGVDNDLFLIYYQNGEPALQTEGRAEPVYDPRDTGQDPDDASTWLWRDNGILVAAHVLRSFPSLTSADLDYDDIADQADLADATVATLTGTEVRARAWGIFPSENARVDVMQQILESIGAEIVPVDNGKYSIRLINDTITPTLEFTTKHILDLDLQSGPESVERPNICRLKYYSPERNYEMAEIKLTDIAWARYQDEIDAVGEQYYDLELPFCPSASQAQRIARLKFEQARADAGIATLNFAGLAAWGESTASFELPDLDQTVDCAIGSPRVNDAEGKVEIPFVVWPTLAAWNPATMEAAAPSILPEMQLASELVQPSIPSNALIVDHPDGKREVRIAFSTVSGALFAEANFRTFTDDLPERWARMTEVGFTMAYREVRRNRFINGDFSSGGPPPTLGSGWSIASGKAVATPGSATAMNWDLGLVSGDVMTIGGVVSDYVAGDVKPRLAGLPDVQGTAITANGPFEQTLTGIVGVNGNVGMYKSSTFDGKLDDLYAYDPNLPIVSPGDDVDFRVRFADADGNGSPFSPILQKRPLAIDNTACGAPSLTSVDSVNATAEVTELRASYIAVERRNGLLGSWSTIHVINVRPGQTYEFTTGIGSGSSGDTVYLRVTTYTSDGTAGTAANSTYMVP